MSLSKPVPDSGGGGLAAAIARTTTTYWLKANDHAHLLDRAQVSVLAKQVIRNQLRWQEAESHLDDWIGAANGAAVKVPVAVSHQPMAERASDPLDELFE